MRPVGAYKLASFAEFVLRAYDRYCGPAGVRSPRAHAANRTLSALNTPELDTQPVQ